MILITVSDALPMLMRFGGWQSWQAQSVVQRPPQPASSRSHRLHLINWILDELSNMILWLKFFWLRALLWCLGVILQFSLIDIKSMILFRVIVFSYFDYNEPTYCSHKSTTALNSVCQQCSKSMLQKLQACAPNNYSAILFVSCHLLNCVCRAVDLSDAMPLRIGSIPLTTPNVITTTAASIWPAW